jgi:hypothetical protein
MVDPTYPIKYDAPPGVTLMKAQKPAGEAGGVEQLESAAVEYARAPDGPGYQRSARPPAVQRNVR